MAINPLIKKLRIKAGLRMIIVNAPGGFKEELGKIPDGVKLAKKLEGKFDLVLLFAKNSQELQRLFPKAKRALKYDGIFWISYPKKSAKVETDLSRDILWELLEDKGLRPVSAVSINTVWSAMRFRPPELVKPKK